MEIEVGKSKRVGETTVVDQITEIVIEKNIRIPSKRSARLSKEGAAMQSMKTGDSFHSEKSYSQIQSIAHRLLGTGNYAIRREMSGVRVWRLK